MINKLLLLLLPFGITPTLIATPLGSQYEIKVSKQDMIKAGIILAAKGEFTAIIPPNFSFKLKPNERIGTFSVGKNFSGKLDRQTFFGLLTRDSATGLYLLNQELSSNLVSALAEAAGISDDEIANHVDGEGVQLGSRGEEYEPFGLVEFTDVGFSCDNVRREDGEKLKPFLERKMTCSTENGKNRETVAKNYEGVLNERLASLAHAEGVQNEADVQVLKEAIQQDEVDIIAAESATAFHQKAIDEAKALMKP